MDDARLDDLEDLADKQIKCYRTILERLELKTDPSSLLSTIIEAEKEMDKSLITHTPTSDAIDNIISELPQNESEGE